MADDLKTDKNEIEKDKKDTEKVAERDKADITGDKKDTESEKERKERERIERKKASQKKYREKIKALNLGKKKDNVLEIKTDMKPDDKKELPSVAMEKKRNLPTKLIFGIVGLVVTAILIVYFMSHNKKDKNNDGFTIERN